MENELKSLIIKFNNFIDNWTLLLQEKKEKINQMLNNLTEESQKINEIINENVNKEGININNERKKLFKIFEFSKIFNKILSQESNNDFILEGKQVLKIFDIIEEYENIFISDNKSIFLLNETKTNSEIKLEQKHTFNFTDSRVSSICYLKDDILLYNFFIVGFSNNKLNLYECESGNILLEISDSIQRNGANCAISICELGDGEIACSGGYGDITILQIKFNYYEINEKIERKLSYNVIQRIPSRKAYPRYSENQIINVVPSFFIEKSNNYINNFIIQSGWDFLTVYIKKKNNNKYYFYKEIKASQRTYPLFNCEKFNYFLSEEYFSNDILIFSSVTMELITRISGLCGNGINYKPFDILNEDILVFVGTNYLYLYNLKYLNEINKIKIDDNFSGLNVIFSIDNNILISVKSKKGNNYKLIKYRYLTETKELERVKEMSDLNFKSNTDSNPKKVIITKNIKGKKYLILFDDSNITIFK